MGDGIAKAAKVGAAAFAATTTAIAGFVTASVKSYAEFEQLEGGVKKLFGTSSDTIMKYAQDAYKNAGLSANEYMTQITNFSASLISSLGGDTAAAVEIGNMAVNDMADNVNTFGSNMADVQNAYQGFAKQNYTMLDNLKLGYGGTKEEMARLINDSKVLGDTFVTTGKKGNFDEVVTFDKVIEAIHKVQEEMNITGTTFNEAEGTISGSIAMTKAAWDNLMVGLADSNADIPQLVANVVSSGTSVLHNIIPVAKEVLKSIPEAISEISPQAGEAFQAILDFANKVFPIVKQVVTDAFNAISNVIGFLKEHTGILEAVAIVVGSVVAAITVYNAVMSVAAAVTALVNAPLALIVVGIGALIGVIVLCVKHWDELKEAVSKVWDSIKEKTKEAVDKVVNWFGEMKQKASDKVNEMKQSVVDKFNAIKQNMSDKISAAKEAVVNKFTEIKTGITNKASEAKTAVVEKFEAIKSGISDKINSAKATVDSVFTSIKTSITDKINAAREGVHNAIEKIKSFFNFTWSLPQIELPHFSIIGNFSLNPLSIPHFSVSWYKNGGVFDMPTMFGYGNGQLGGLGEDGAEAVVPLEKNTQWLTRIADMLSERMGGGGPIFLQVDGKTFAQISVDSINQLTRQTGSLPLRLV